jgi:hypothetical protein
MMRIVSLLSSLLSLLLVSYNYEVVNSQCHTPGKYRSYNINHRRRRGHQHSILIGDSCSPCNAGNYQDQPNSANDCKNCPLGKYNDENQQGACLGLCPIGKTTFQVAGKELSDCKVCPTGYINPIAGQGACTICPKGKYWKIPNIPATNCTNCWTGTYQYEEGQTSCDLCLPGLYLSEEAGVASTKCKACPSGWRDSNNRKVCIKCPIGRYQKNERQGHCDTCSRNNYQDEEQSIVCKKCTVNNYQNETGQSSCTNVWNDGLGCRYNPNIENINDYKTDCEK